MPYNSSEKRRKYRQWYDQEHRDKIREKQQQQREKNREYFQKYDQKYDQKRRCGSVERYNEATLKYEGECAFACGKKAEMIHHLDGKNIRNSPKEEVNNELSNLLPLCKPCHSWLHNLRWRGRRNNNAIHQRSARISQSYG